MDNSAHSQIQAQQLAFYKGFATDTRLSSGRRRKIKRKLEISKAADAIAEIRKLLPQQWGGTEVWRTDPGPIEGEAV